LALLNNYTADTSEEEVLTDEDLKEDEAFIRSIMNTPLMREAHQ